LLFDIDETKLIEPMSRFGHREKAKMQITNLKVKNFRGLKDISMPLSQFGCLIGENNSGKSTAMQALILALPLGGGRKATIDDFYNRSESIRIELQVDGVTDADLDRLTTVAHRESLSSDIVGGSITFVRLIELEGLSVRSSFVVMKLGPRNELWLDENLTALMKGKSGAELKAAVVNAIPELASVLPATPTQALIREKRDELVSALHNDDLTMRDKPLATGIEAGLKNFLPEPIYIETIKDVADEIKTTDSATFGKLLGLLLEEVKDKFSDIEQRFVEIQRQLSRVFDAETGAQIDDRLDEVKLIESLLNGFVKESFPDVDLKIEVPVPKMKAILAGAEIYADDGHDGLVVSKGDGLKRTVAFAILRAYTTLRNSGIGPSTAANLQSNYWLLFEEPELFLYPRAQKQLFSALEFFAKEHRVLVTTHSPLFFDANTTKTFVKFRKVRPILADPPFAEVDTVAIDSLPIKSAFQIICHENNNIGFFAKTVVLVEGDSDALIFTYLARLLEPTKWDAIENNVAFARIGGKGNINNYRSFFRGFRIPVFVITDLDTIIRGFEQLEPSAESTAIRNRLIAALDSVVSSNETREVTEGQAQTISRSGDARSLWGAALASRASLADGSETFEQLKTCVDQFFAFATNSDRLEVLKTGGSDIQTLKKELLNSLATENAYVLSLGSVEEYYEANSANRDKVRQAIEFCSIDHSLEEFRSGLGTKAGTVEMELRNIFGALFGSLEQTS
jgi:putative ATP-dependent endonuclease of OLD family